MTELTPLSDEELVRMATELDEKLSDEQKLELAQELERLIDLLPQGKEAP